MIKKIIAINIFTFLCMLLFSVVYPLVIWGVGQFTQGQGKGRILSYHGKTVGFEQEGQLFTGKSYFWGRPSVVNYNGAGSGGSNKGPSNPDYLKEVELRMDTFLIQHPYLNKSEVPAEMVTASGSGLDPHISPASAFIQAKRVADERKISLEKVNKLIHKQIKQPLFGAFGPSTINVLELNLALEQMQTNKK